MIELLSKIFIKNKNGKNLREAYGTLCSCAGIGFNILLFAIKFIAGSISGAISVTADAFNNLSDSGSSVITLLGFRLAGKKPDPSHPFGHGRMEYLSGLAVSVLILVMGVELLKSSVDKILHPEAPEISALVFVILAVSIAVKLYMWSYNRKYGKKYSSSAMLATASDCISDVASTSVVLVSMLITYFADVNVDAYCGTAVALFILYAGGKSAYETVQPLLGMPPEKEFVDEIERIVLESGVVLGIHDMIVHDYGPGRCMVSLHAEVPAEGNILELHDEIDNIERTLCETLGCIVTIHMDPIQTDDEVVNELKFLALEAVESIDPAIRMHDFRVVIGETHTNLIFDVLVSYSFKMEDEALKEEIGRRVKEKDPKLFCVITVDKDYVESK